MPDPAGTLLVPFTLAGVYIYIYMNMFGICQLLQVDNLQQSE